MYQARGARPCGCQPLGAVALNVLSDNSTAYAEATQTADIDQSN